MRAGEGGSQAGRFGLHQCGESGKLFHTARCRDPQSEAQTRLARLSGKQPPPNTTAFPDGSICSRPCPQSHPLGANVLTHLWDDQFGSTEPAWSKNNPKPGDYCSSDSGPRSSTGDSSGFQTHPGCPAPRGWPGSPGPRHLNT